LETTRHTTASCATAETTSTSTTSMCPGLLQLCAHFHPGPPMAATQLLEARL
ncbi:hypothetical protein HaLaN_32666, partial [Haematococcus lacustris]